MGKILRFKLQLNPCFFRPDNSRFNSRSKYSGRQNIYSSSGPGGEFGAGLGPTSFSYNRRTEGQAQGSRRNSFSNNINSNNNNFNNRPMSGFQNQNSFNRNTAANNRPASSGYDYVQLCVNCI